MVGDDHNAVRGPHRLRGERHRPIIVAVLGEAELANGTLTVKHLQSGEQDTLTIAEAVAMIQRQLPAGA